MTSEIFHFLLRCIECRAV